MRLINYAQLFVAVVILLEVRRIKSATLDYNILYNQKNQVPVRSLAANSSGPTTCGYESCPRTSAGKINVHLIAHTHDDVGWLKTVDQYYYGTNKQYSEVGVQYILDSVIPQLLMDKSKRFIYVEMSFFSKWWDEQDDAMKNIVKKLVEEGRLEFINGGWCMNDEATVTYHSTIEQMTLGLKFLEDNFGHCARPKVGWQIDPFGHTNEQASLFSQFGFDGMFFTRESYLDKAERTLYKNLDLIWHGDRALNDQSGSIFTNIFRDGYDAPTGYCFDAYCKDEILVDNKKSYEYNLDSRGHYMIGFIREYAQSKLTNHVLIPFGGDFQFSAAGQNFKSLDKLINYINSNAPDINIFYSTPSCYQYSVYNYLEESKLKLPEKFDDFMPYDSSPSVWWSGYFSSRPSVKLIERETANLLQVARTVSMGELIRKGTTKATNWVNSVKQHESQCLNQLWEVLGDLQHHDAVTGTEKQHVADDYVRRAYDAWITCVKFIGDIRRKQLVDSIKHTQKYKDHVRSTSKSYSLEPIFLEETMLCPLLNISQCDAVESEVDIRRFMVKNNSSDSKISNKFHGAIPQELVTKSVLMTVYNPLAKPLSHYDIRLPCNGRCDLSKVRIIHLATNESMTLTRLSVPGGILSLSFRDAKTTYEVLFYADIPALGTTSFIIEDENSDDLVDEESDSGISPVESRSSSRHKSYNKNRRIKVLGTRYDYLDTNVGSDFLGSHHRHRRESGQSFKQHDADRVVVKFDMNTGLITGLKRVSDGSVLNITQRFGYYFPANHGAPPGAYIFRPNSSEPELFERPLAYKMLKRHNGALIEIHQKWAEWIWQTIRVDARKNYIEFDYVVGPIPTHGSVGREVVSRYTTNMANAGIFMTDSGARQLLPRHRLRDDVAEQLGGSFYPVVSTIMLRNNANSARNNKTAEAVAILVDRAQAGTSLNEGEIELLVHRRQMRDDNFGVSEALNELGEDGRGLVTRGKHRLYLKFHDKHESNPVRGKSDTSSLPELVKLPDRPRANLTFEERKYSSSNSSSHKDVYLVNDQVLNDLRQESIKAALKPILTFDRLRVSANELIDMLTASNVDNSFRNDEILLNGSLPSNVHLLTLQPWNKNNNELLLRLENLDNPLTLYPYPNNDMYLKLLKSYQATSSTHNSNNICDEKARPMVEIDVEYLIKHLRIVSLTELSLGANSPLNDVRRLNWTNERPVGDACESRSRKPTQVKLSPRQIRTFLAKIELLEEDN